MNQEQKPFLPRVESFQDCTGRTRSFNITQGQQPEGVLVTASEIDPPQMPGYEFAVWSSTMGNALGLLRLKIKEGISRRYLGIDTGRGVEMLTHTVRGMLDYGGVVVDGRVLSYDQLLQVLSSFEGSAIEIKITDPTT